MLAKDKIRLQALRGVKRISWSETAKEAMEASDEAAVKILQKDD